MLLAQEGQRQEAITSIIRSNQPMGIESELDKAHLPDDIQKRFEELIDESIDIAYCEYEEEPFSIAAPPFDGAHARHLLIEMWGDLITQDAIDAACERFEANYAEAIADDCKAHAGE